jgi:hypothetical protein
MIEPSCAVAVISYRGITVYRTANLKSLWGHKRFMRLLRCRESVATND